MKRSLLPGAVVLLLAGPFVLGGAGCEDETDAPVRVAREFSAAMHRGDIEAMLVFVESDVVAHLEATAEQASDQVGGRRNIEPREMLQVVPTESTFAIASATLVDNDGTVAHVRLVGPQDEEHVLELVQQEGSWRVRLPIPVGSTRESS